MQEGFAAHGRGEVEVATECYRRILAADPRHADALFLMGELAARRRDWDAARDLYERALASNAGEAAFHVGYGIALHNLGSYDESYDALRRSLELREQAGDRGAYAPPPAAVPVPGTTLVCADCRNHRLAADAISRTLDRCRFERALFFTDVPMEIGGVETIEIPRIASSDDYSRFVMKELEGYVDTEFALVIQFDGYVLDGSRWSTEFQQYDYIGARWDLKDGMAVGNGGFSLRSRRLLAALQDPRIDAGQTEDLAICRTYRPLLEQEHGIRFAPEPVAERFAFETVPSSVPTFGFHGLGHLVFLYGMSDAQIGAYRPRPFHVTAR
jgi:tetratricopeptide (TPR) repeat protein